MARRMYYLLYNAEGIKYDPNVDVLLGFGSQSAREDFMLHCVPYACGVATYYDVRGGYDLSNPIATSGHYIFNPRQVRRSNGC